MSGIAHLMDVLGRTIGGAAVLAAAWGVAPAAEPASRPVVPAHVEVISDITYIQRGADHALKLDLYRPAGEHQPKPLVIWVHGGGWTMGSKSEWVNPMFVTSRGFILASIDYRLSPEAPFPAQIADCKAAVRFLRAHASDYGIAADRIAAIGESAGGNLVSLLGTTGDAPEFADPAEPVSDVVQAVVDVCGPADLTVSPTSAAAPFVTKLLRGTPAERPEAARAASPCFRVRPEDPPFLILHAQGDPVVPVTLSQAFLTTLKQAGVPSELVIVPVAQHVGPFFWTGGNQDRILSFLGHALHLPSAP